MRLLSKSLFSDTSLFRFQKCVETLCKESSQGRGVFKKSNVCPVEKKQLNIFHCLYGQSAKMVGGWENNPLVPDYVKPIVYDLFINPDLKQGIFEGIVSISLQITNAGSYLPVHIKNLKVKCSTLTQSNGDIVPIETYYCEKNQFLVHSVPKEQYLQPGDYRLDISFEGSLTGKLSGFYKCTYVDEKTKELRSMATTKFEPVDARQAFPCFDEPALKAKFKIRIVRPKNEYSALSNMNVVKEEPGPGPNDVTVHFSETVPMSTYLVCFIVSDFLHSGEVMVENKGKPFPVKIYASPGQVQNTLFAKSAAAAVSKYYIDYFDIPYALPKMDLIAIPDFISGAMENWGLITFRETEFLFNENENSATNKQRVATVVSHEISHQWFGNLVTMKWWDDLWLNEGFASFMQFKGVQHGIPECKDWQMVDQAIYGQIFGVMKSDAVVSSHPIIQTVNDPNQITEIFDKISYNKGHAVLKMLEGFMGEENFKRGIQKYLKQHAFSNAATPDLWSVLNKELNEQDINVGNVMDTWTRQMGLPLVSVENNGDHWLLKQQRFLSDPSAKYDPSESPYGYKWDIPIHYIVGKNIHLAWLKRNQESLKIPRVNGVNLIKLNHQMLGFYRVNYDLDTWKEFEDLLRNNYESLNRIDRANLIDDAFNLASARKLDYSVALGMTAYLKKEKEFLPWATASDSLHELIQLLSSSVYYPNMRKYVKELVSDMYGNGPGQFSWDVHSNDTHIYRKLRVTILALACKSGHKACLNDAGEKFVNWIKNPKTRIHPDVRTLVYRYGMKTAGGEEEWDLVWNRYLTETNVQEKINLLRALASVREPWLLSRYLEFAKNESYIRSQDYFSVLSYISGNPIGNPIVWKFFRNEWPYLVKRFTLSHRGMGTFIATVTSQFSTQVELEEVEAFCKKYPEAGAGVNARKTAINTIKQNIIWLEKNEKVIGQWLKDSKF